MTEQQRTFAARVSEFFSPTVAKGEIRFPFGQLIADPWGILLNNFRGFALISLYYALLLSLLYLAGGQSLLCGYRNFELDVFCSQSLNTYIVIHVLSLYLTGMFCVRIYRNVWQHEELTCRFLIFPVKRDIWSFGILAAALVLNMTALLSWQILSWREPNPDWRIELAFFGVVGIGFLVPFALMRIYGLLAFVWSGDKLPSVWKIWKKTRGNSLRLIIGLAVIFFVLMFVMSTLMSKMWHTFGEGGSYLGVFAAEYVYNFVLLLVMGSFVNFCAIQKLYLTEGEDNENSD